MTLHRFLLALLMLLFAGCSQRANVITWETASEVDTAGFNVYRGPTADGPWTRVNETLIPAAEDPVRGGRYSFTDESAEPGQSYYYMLEEVELGGATHRFPPEPLRAGAALPGWPLWVAGGLVALGLGWLLGNRWRPRGSEPGV